MSEASDRGKSTWAQAVLDDDACSDDSPPQMLWQNAVLDDSAAAQNSSAALQASTNEAERLRELTDDDSDSGQSPSQEDLSGRWWWAPRLCAAARAVTGERLCASFPPQALRVMSCCTGASSESEALKAPHTFMNSHHASVSRAQGVGQCRQCRAELCLRVLCPVCGSETAEAAIMMPSCLSVHNPLAKLENIALQALGIEFCLLSASESRADFREFFMDSNPGKSIKHVYDDVRTQLKGGCCLLHVGQRRTCHAANREEIDLMISGSPCDPFSLQSGKRFQDGSVVQHRDYQITMETIVGMYAAFQPPLGIFEQVEGFLMRFDSTTSATPYTRPTLCSIACVLPRTVTSVESRSRQDD